MSSIEGKDDSAVTKQMRAGKIEKLFQNNSVPVAGKSFTGPATTTESSKVTLAFYYEEDEAGHRNPNVDLELHRTVCMELQRVMDSIRDLKNTGCKNTNAEFDELKIHGILQFLSLKKLNRIAHFRSKKIRDFTNEAKLKVDQHHLKLQNLLYEVGHLEKEIDKCLQFRSKDEEICLVPMEQFYEEASADIARQKLTEDHHQLKLARLHWELEQRKRLSAQLKEAAGLKDHIMSDIKTKKEFLESLQPKLSSILQVTKPVQDHLGMPFDKIRDQHRTASYLPSPLYVLYVQAMAYSDACDKNLLVNILGDVELARTMEQTPVFFEDKDNDDERDEQEKSTDIGRRRSSQHDKMHHLLRKHPLSVCLTIRCLDKSQLILTFSYVVPLSIVTVCVKLSPHDATSTISAGDLLTSDSLLNCLYPDDDGTTSPNPSNAYLTTVGEFGKYASEVGHPYLWVQWLCGLQFLASDPQKVQVSVSACRMADTIRRLHQRVQDRLSLQKLFASLELCKIPIPNECVSLYPAKVSSRLVHWKRTTYQDFMVCSYTHRFTELGIVRSDSMFFTAVLQRDSAVLTAQVVIGADYPSHSSLMMLSLLWHSTVPRTALNDDAIRDMEIEVNQCDNEPVQLSQNGCFSLLTNQLQRLLICLDVYLEIQSVMSLSAEFSQDRICSRLTRGRNRARPFKYVSQLCFFTQR